MQKTLTIIKPDAVARCYAGEILAQMEKNGLVIKALKMLKLSREQACEFYIVHHKRPFYDDLTDYMSSGPVIAAVLEGDNAIDKVRSLLGATDPNEAEAGTLRAQFGQNRQENAIHASDSPESADFEIPFIFSQLELSNYEKIFSN